MDTNLENRPLQYRAICGILSRLDLTKPDAPIALKSETVALLDNFSEADWDSFLRMAKAEGVAPLLYHAMTRSAFQPPETTRLRLQTNYYETAAFNQVILTEKERVTRSLNDIGIPVIVLKGAALATTIYPDPALRPMNDLDLLAPSTFVGKALNCLRNQGCELLKITNHAVLQSTAKPTISIELHWTLAGQHHISNKEMVRVITDLAKVPISSNSHIIFDLLYLCAHLELQNTSQRLIWLFDIFSFLQHYQQEIIWSDLQGSADQLDWMQVFLNVLHKIEDLFNYSLPQDLKKYLNESGNHSKPIYLIPESTRDSVRNAFIALNLLDRILMVIYFLFPTPAYLRWRYKNHRKWQILFLYPYRWWEILSKGMSI